MGLLRSLIGVDHENVQWCYVHGCDVDGRSGDFLSYLFLYFDPILLFGFFLLDFYSFCLTIMVVICFFFNFF